MDGLSREIAEFFCFIQSNWPDVMFLQAKQQNELTIPNGIVKLKRKESLESACRRGSFIWMDQSARSSESSDLLERWRNVTNEHQRV